MKKHDSSEVAQAVGKLSVGLLRFTTLVLDHATHVAAEILATRLFPCDFAQGIIRSIILRQRNTKVLFTIADAQLSGRQSRRCLRVAAAGRSQLLACVLASGFVHGFPLWWV